MLSGGRGRRFESSLPDHFPIRKSQNTRLNGQGPEPLTEPLCLPRDGICHVQQVAGRISGVVLLGRSAVIMAHKLAEFRH